MKRAPFFLFCLLIIPSCHNSLDRQFDDIECLLDSNPKLALEKIDSLPRDLSFSLKERARYSLLKSMALDKNYIDVAQDSLICPAVEYYERHGDAQEKAKSFYYQGVVLRNGDHFIDAILALEKAEKAAIQAQAHYYLGLIYRTKGDIFSRTGNNAASVTNLEKSVTEFELAGKDRHVQYGKLSLATSLINARQFDKAKAVMEGIRNLSVSDSFAIKIQVNDAVIAAEENRWEESLHIFQQVPVDYLGVLDLGYYAAVLSRTGHLSEADSVLEAAYQLTSDTLQAASLDYISSRIKMQTGQAEVAYGLLSHATSVQDSLTRSLLEQSISCAQRDYYKNEMILEERLRKNDRERWTFAFILSCSLFLCATALYIRKIRERNTLIQDQMSRMGGDRQYIQQMEQDQAKLLGSLFSQRLNKLNQLSASYKETDDEKQRGKLFLDFKEELNRLSKDKELFHTLEADLDRYCGNIMTKLAQQVPHIKKDNRTIISLFFAGIDYDTIRILLHRNSVQSLKTLKSRMKTEILESGAPDTELFLRMLQKRG